MRTGTALLIWVWLLAPLAHAGEDGVDGRPRLVAQAGHARGISVVACSPDGRLVLTGGDKAARLWDAASGKELRSFAALRGVVTAVAFSPDGRHALTSETGAARLWDVRTGAEVRRFAGNPERAFRDVAFHPDGRQMATAGPNRLVVLWDVATGEQIGHLEGHERDVRSVAFSPDGRWVASAGSDRTARLWEAATGREVRRFEGHARLVQSVAFSPDGRLVATGSWDGTARVWRRDTGVEVRRLSGHGGWVADVGFSSDGRRIVTASHDGTARVWDAGDGRLLQQLDGHRDAVRSACFTADDRHVLTGSEDRLALLFDATTGQAVRRFAGHAVRVTASCFSPDGHRLATAGRDGRIRLWDVRSGTPGGSFSGHEGAAYSVCFSPDGRRVLTAGLDRTARLWDAETGRELQRFRGHEAAVWSASFSPDGRWVVTGSRDETARLWDAAAGTEVRRFEGHDQLVWPARFSPDGRRVLTGSLDGTARLWDAETGVEIRRFASRGAKLVATVGFSPDGLRVVTAGDGRVIRIWDAGSAEEEQRLEGHTGAVRSVTFSSDGTRVLSAGNDGTARVWNAATGEEVLRLERHPDEVFSASFSPDGRRILTSGDVTARLWDAKRGSEICRLVSFELGPWAVVAPDGRFDTNWADEVRGLHWVMPDDPLTPLDVEVFARDHYEPRLLPRLLANAAFAPTRPLQDLERVQPTVRITRIEADSQREDAVSVTVEVEGRRRVYGNREHASGASDLRLFRDGRLVRYTEGTLALDPKTHRAVRIFSGVAIPQAGSVPFSAYAFNADGVKSRTHRRAYERAISPAASPRERTAYVVAVGIDAFDDPRWDLRFAVADAKALCTQLTDRLRRSEVYDRVVPVLLTSEPEAEGSARRSDLESVLRLLAGRPVTPERSAALSGAEGLRAARPEDLLVVTLSTHGYTDAEGRFHLLPSDVAKGEPNAAWLASCISADSLSRWLRDVDAGEMVMIVDACHAAASVEAEGFKPGPMGSRGLGQIAYDKRMQILAASQAADVALESPLVRHGLLTYALVEDGLVRGRADFDPADDRITLTEWLRYGERRVPSLAEEILRGAVSATDDRGPVRDRRRTRRARPVAQRPSLFDFAGRRTFVVLEN